MSLRAKSLIAALVLIISITFSLGVWMQNASEKQIRKQINKQLGVAANRLNSTVSRARTRAISELKQQRGSFRSLIKIKNLEIGDGFSIPARDWVRVTEADIGIAFFDRFMAEENKSRPTVLAKYQELLACAFVKNKASKNQRDIEELSKKILGDSGFRQLVNDSYRNFNSDSPESDVHDIMLIDQSIYLVVIHPLIESFQDADGAIGMAVVLKELSNQWAQEQVEEFDGAELLISSGTSVAGHTFDHKEEAELILRKKGNSVDRLFELTHRESFHRFNALSQEFSDSRNVSFILLKNLDAELQPILSELKGRLFLSGGILTVIGVLFAFSLAGSAVKRVQRLEELTHVVQQGDFTQRINVKGSDELSRLGVAFNDMNKGLEALSFYTDPELAKGVVQGNLQIEVQEVEGSIFFSDIADFTSISEKLESRVLVEQLNDYFTVMGDAIKRTGGYLDKFIGDSVMAFWGAPLYKADDFAEQACVAALYCKMAEADLADKWRSQGKLVFEQRIGIATGETIVGNIGSRDKKNFTVIGDDVNLASRLEGANKFYGTKILLDHSTAEKVEGKFLVREIDQIYLKGKSISMRVFELVSFMDRASEIQKRSSHYYGEALAAYRVKNFSGAIEALDELQKMDANDGPSRWLKAVCTELNIKGPSQNWEPVTLATGK